MNLKFNPRVTEPFSSVGCVQCFAMLSGPIWPSSQDGNYGQTNEVVLIEFDFAPSMIMRAFCIWTSALFWAKGKLHYATW